jgi:hypothetical protein
MSRIIKFRAWSKTDHKMIYKVLCGNTETDNPCSAVLHKEDDFAWTEFDKFCGEIMQFTGLLDKNGKEIYEGDIVDVGKGLIYLVEFKFGEFRFYSLNSRLYGGEEYHISIGAHSRDSKVIGNIYENPEFLIKQEVL